MIPASASAKQKQIIAILTKGDKEYKAAFVVQQTGESHKNSTNDLTHQQANSIIEQLGGKPIVYDNWAFFDKTKTNHLKVISEAMSYGMTVPHAKYGYICDLGRLSEWLKNHAPVKKRLLDMKHYEVSKTIVALENMVLKNELKTK